MIKHLIVALLMLAFASAAEAQQSATPNEQALGNKLLQEINSGIACSAAVIGLQKQVSDAQQKIKEMETATKPKSE